MGQEEQKRPKPTELVELAVHAELVFEVVQKWYDIHSWTFDLSNIAADQESLQGHRDVAAFVLRKLQAIWCMPNPDFVTTPRVVVAHLAQLQTSLAEIYKWTDGDRTKHEVSHLEGMDMRIRAATTALSRLAGGDGWDYLLI